MAARPLKLIASYHHLLTPSFYHRISHPITPLRHVAFRFRHYLPTKTKRPAHQSSLPPPPPQPLPSSYNRHIPSLYQSETLAQKIGKAIRRPGAPSKARVYSDINVIRPSDYWDYESVTVQWGLATCLSIYP